MSYVKLPVIRIVMVTKIFLIPFDKKKKKQCGSSLFIIFNNIFMIILSTSMYTYIHYNLNPCR